MIAGRNIWSVFSIFGLCFLVGTAPAAGGGTAVSAQLAPHRAIYEMTLDEARPGSGITALLGYMMFEFRGSACRGFTLDLSVVNSVTNLNGDTALMDLRTNSWERGDGKKFRFHSKQYQDSQLVEATEGNASADGNEERLLVKLVKPAEVEVKFPGKVVFPTHHSLMLLEAANAGRSILQADIYDGAEDGVQVFRTTAFIGDRVDAGGKPVFSYVKNAEPLDALPSWPVSVSYYNPTKAGDSLPTYELSFQLYGNGVSRGLLIDYGNYVVTGSMIALQFLDTPSCE